MGDPGFIIPFALIQAAVLLLLVWGLDVYEREPLGLVGLMALWGATVAPAVAITVREPLLRWLPHADDIERAMSAALIEEPIKGGALLLVMAGSALAARRFGQIELEGATDGLVYGAAIGLGFAFTENVFYLVQQATLQEGLDVFVDRADLLGISMATHAVYTGMFGAALGSAAWERSRFNRIVLALLGLAGAVVLHAVHNGLAAAGQETARRAVDYGMVVGFVVTFALWARHQSRVIERGLAEEVESGLISAAQAEDASSYLKRQRRRVAMLRSGDLAGIRASQSLELELTELAFAKWRLERVGPKGKRLALEQRRETIRDLADY